MTKRHSLTPYRQGRLDGLCGVYAVINAVRLACAGERRRIHLPSRLLFEACLSFLELNQNLRESIIHGMDTDTILACLRIVQNYLQVKRGIELRQSRPFLRKRGLGIADIAHNVRLFLAKPHRSVLLGYDAARPDDGHWTVVQGVAHTHFILLDSSGSVRLTFAKLTYRDWHKAKLSRKRNLTPSGIIFLERVMPR